MAGGKTKLVDQFLGFFAPWNFIHCELASIDAPRRKGRKNGITNVASIHEAHEALAGIQFYIGDGAAITRPILRKRDDALIGHASIRMQLEWCRTERVPAAIFTHCGSEIVKGDQRRVEEKIAALGEAAGVDTS